VRGPLAAEIVMNVFFFLSEGIEFPLQSLLLREEEGIV
jgi:hypothetical protein